MDGREAALLGTFLDAAEGRIAAIRRASVAGERDDVAYALHSLKGLCAQADQLELAERCHRLEERLDAVGADELTLELDVVGRALAAIPGADRATRTMPASAIADRIAGELAAVARRRDVRLTFDRAEVGEVAIPRRTAALLLDVMGHLGRNAVVHGARHGRVRVALRIVEAGGGLVCELTDDGSGSPPVATAGLDSGRGLGLAAARSRVEAAGGALECGPVASGFRARASLPAEWLQTGKSG